MRNKRSFAIILHLIMMLGLTIVAMAQDEEKGGELFSDEGFLTAAVAAEEEAALDPPFLLADLQWAMAKANNDPNTPANPPYPNWESMLDRTLNRWSNGSSQNWGPIAHAIALWRYPANSPDTVAWWNVFFDCQNSQSVPCVRPGTNQNLGWLRYMKGSELLSNTYDASVVSAVVGVHYWAVKNNNVALADKARRFLRVTLVMYGLSAGQGSAKMIRNHYTPNPEICQIAANGTGDYYSGPYLTLAGMRSTLSHICQEDRGPLFSRALQLSFVNKREMDEQKALLDYVQARWPAGRSENAYALAAADRTLLSNHLQTGNAALTFKGMLAGVRTSSVYHFFGWRDNASGKQIRATVMEINRNGNTAAVYAVKYNHATREAQALYPWAADTATSRGSRHGITAGYGKLLPNAVSPTQVEASSAGPGQVGLPPHCVGGTPPPGQPCVPLYTIRMDLPTPANSVLLYHITLSPTQDAY